MNIRALNLTSATAALLLAASLAGCGAAHVPSAGQGEVTGAAGGANEALHPLHHRRAPLPP